MDVQAALRDGYSKQEVMAELGRRTGMKYQQALKDGHSEDDIISEMVRRTSGTPSNDPSTYPQGKSAAEAERMRREFLRSEGTLPTRIRNTPPEEAARNIALEVPRFAQEIVTVPLSSAKKGLYGLGALAKAGGSILRGNDLDTALRTGAEAMQGYTPVQGPLESSMTGEAISRGIENLSSAAESATGNTGFAQAGIQAGADVLGLVGGGKAAMKGARSLADLGRTATERGLGTLPEKLYGSSIKQSTVIPMSQRAANIKTGLEGGYIPNKKGLSRLYDDINSVNNQISQAIQDSTNAGGTVSVDAINSRLADVRQRAIDSFGDNNSVLAKIDNFEQSLRDHPSNRNGQIPVNVAQRMKVNTYKELKNAYGELKGFEVEAKKAMARGAKEEIVSQIPELAELNSKDSALINLEKVLFKAVNRIENRDLIGIGVPIKAAAGAIGGPKGAIIGAITGLIDTPAIKSNLAVALHKARTKMGQRSTISSAKIDANNILQALAAQRGEQPSQEQ